MLLEKRHKEMIDSLDVIKRKFEDLELTNEFILDNGTRIIETFLELSDTDNTTYQKLGLLNLGREK